ncbi:apolipoprotein N-acyltransferase [Pedobacter psychroterrae]|uniref:Apolipoprotein N-acyltransferase n=1 Tax=Pedobacter psychroterrae TaxID=2530453 RepID=A0A4R0NU86_9SPHI|nr:apolipoprotein N-acyltransferase [Pedobacter psychroterrae]TCD03543.1 apolipoprotein N-acyltransferase [Pedobacter psychroterrae]
MKIVSNVYFLGLLSSFLMWLAWPPINYTTPLLLIGLVPLLIALSAIKADDRSKKGKRVFLTAGLTFLVWNTASIYWVYNAISAVNDPLVAALVSIIPFGLGALLMTFAFWLYYRLGLVANKYIAYAGLICFYIAMEYLHQTWDLSFPWMTLGNGLAGMHQLAQWYEYTGVYGGSLWILLSNIVVFEAYKEIKQAGGWKALPILVPAIVILVPIGLSLTTYYNYTEKVVPLNVVAVQPNIDPYKKFVDLPVRDQLDILIKLSDSVAQPNTEYFIWPETAIPNYADEEKIHSNPEFIIVQHFLDKYKNGTVLTGIESVRFYNEQKTITAKNWGYGIFKDNFNSAMQVENSANVQFYHKSKLVPGVEKMPFPVALSVLAPIFEQFGGSSGGWGWQDNPEVFYSQSGVGVVPVICYESLWGEWIGEAVRNGAQFIAVITNDAWWGNTSGKEQHLLYAKLRAIEARRYVVRSANTGISGFINQRGDILTQSKWWTRTAMKADINLNDEITPYVKNGDMIAIISCIIGALLALLIPFYKISSVRKRSV